MANTKVLVVDDSLTMRALISGALEKISDVEVVGVADGAAEARQMVEQFKPHVMTLDVEMPGMSGLEYLAELMDKRPMPVIMFSTRTQAGAEDSIEALRLGAIDCFPKPKVAAPAELDAIITKLGKRIKAARNADLKKVDPAAAAPVEAAPVALDWNGRLVTIGADAANTKDLFELFATFPADCPPTVVVQHMAPGLLAPLVAKLDEQVAPKVLLAEDRMPVEQGKIYFAPQGEQHLVLDSWPNGNLRLLARDPIAGERPSISLLFAGAAKACRDNAVGVLLALDEDDGSAGLRALLAGGGYGFARVESGFTLSRGAASQPVERPGLGKAVLKLCSK